MEEVVVALGLMQVGLLINISFKMGEFKAIQEAHTKDIKNLKEKVGLC